MAATELASVDIAAAAPVRRRTSWLRGMVSGKTIVGLSIVGLFTLLAIFGPMLAPYDPAATSDAILQGPSAEHWLGTTQIGQDLLSQMLYGARTSMLVGFVAAAIATVVSVVVGLGAGYLGGLSDEVLSFITTVFLVIPSLPLTVILVSYIPKSGSAGVILVIAVTGWAWGARVLRAQTLSLRRRDFVEASRAMGARTTSIIWRDILPNQMAIIASAFLGTVTGAILTQASLAFLGLTSVTEWSWGTILYWAQVSSALLQGAWWWFVPAGLAIALVGTGLALVNFGIDEFVNPRLRSVGLGTKESQRNRRARRGTSAWTRPAAGADQRPATGPGASGSEVLRIEDVCVEYGTSDVPVRAVDHVSLTLRRGEVLGLAGESGSGKSTLAHAITRLHRPPARVTEGRFLYTAPDGASCDVFALDDEELRRFRWEELALVFQSAMNSLNPVLRIGTQIDDTLLAHRPEMPAADRLERARELLALVGLRPEWLTAYPHELSGGMRQRAVIAIALALDPEIIVMDEPTTALDVVIQRQIVEKLMELKDRLGFAIVFITHDLSLLLELSDTIAVMYGGKVVEVATKDEFAAGPKHPYSQGLLASFPNLTGPRRTLQGIPGSPPDLKSLPSGCALHPRCPFAQDQCRVVVPELRRVTHGDSAWQVACHLVQDDEQLVEANAQEAK